MKEPISALRRFLLNTPLEDLFGFLDSLDVKFTVSVESRSRTGRFRYLCRIYVQRDEGIPGKSVKTVREYKGTAADGKGLKPAVADALARFFIRESVDYHDYRRTKATGEIEE